jgi:hypothetical protein
MRGRQHAPSSAVVAGRNNAGRLERYSTAYLGRTGVAGRGTIKSLALLSCLVSLERILTYKIRIYGLKCLLLYST